MRKFVSQISAVRTGILYMHIWMLRPCLQVIMSVCYTGVPIMDFLVVHDFGKVEECKCISCHCTCIIGSGYESKGCALYILDNHFILVGEFFFHY